MIDLFRYTDIGIPLEVQEAITKVMPALIELDCALMNNNMPYPGTQLTLYLGGHHCIIEGESLKNLAPNRFGYRIGRSA